ncbi:MAG: hypothetical protein RLZZ618_646 [Pseudomonadota bacterium]|jgi:hypothetical protein
MNNASSPSHCSTRCELHYHSMGHDTLCFPCDEAGHVDLDGLSERERIDYLYARAMVGREVSRPEMVATLS